MKRKREPRTEPNDASAPAARASRTGAAELSSAPATSSRKWLFRFAAIFLVPLLALAALEAGLRVVRFGYDTHLFKPLRIKNEQFLVENDKFSLRFFPPELARTPGPIRMLPRKPSGTYRIFILGESAAMGDPEPGFGAGRYLEVLLRERFPAAKFEIINVAFTAINSHVILPIARECAAHEGDLWIVYMGNNEMVGPFGAVTVFGPQAPPLRLVRLKLAMLNTRLGQLLAVLAHKLKPKSSTPPSWGGMQMFLGGQVLPDSPRKETVYQSFGRNLNDILRAGRAAGVRILLNTVAVNLKDCPPFASASSTNLPMKDQALFDQFLAEGAVLEDQGRFVEAAQRYENAATLHPQSADVQYRWGRCLLGLTNAAAARQHFESACDRDTLPFRADSRINDLIRQAALAAADSSVLLFDAAQWVATNAPARIPGQEAFYEHVHFNFDGNYHLALGWADQIARSLPAALTVGAASSWASQEICERRLGLTDWNRCIAVEGVIRRMRQPPLSAQSLNRQRVAALQSWVSGLRRRMDPAAVMQARALYLDALQRAPDDPCLHENFASFLVANRDLLGATAQWQQVADLIPQDYLANLRQGELLGQQGRRAEAELALSTAAALRPFLSDPWCELGKVHVGEGNLNLALREFTHANRLRPGEPESGYQIGRTLALQNRRTEAIEQFRKTIQVNPDYWQAHDALGGQLGLAGEVKEARTEFETVIRLAPEYAPAHLNLGVALLKQGFAEGAAREFQEALRLDPTNSVARSFLQQAQSSAAPPR